MPYASTASPAETRFVEASINNLRAFYDESFRMTHQLRRMRFMRMKSKAPKPFQRLIAQGIQSPMSYRLVQTVVGALAKERPKFARIPINPKDREAAGRLQRACDPLLQDLETVVRQPLYWQFMDQLVADGRGCWKVTRDVWKGFPVQNQGEDDASYNKRVADFITTGSNHPIRARLVDSLNFLVPPEDYEPSYVIEQGKRPVLETLFRCGMMFEGEGAGQHLVEVPTGVNFHELELPRGMSPTQDVEEVWTPDYCYLRVAGHVMRFENEMGVLPYVWAFGEVSSHPDPAVHSMSVLYPYANLEPWLNTMLSTLAAWGVIGGTPILYTTRKPVAGVPSSGEMGAVQDIPLGKRVDLPPGGEIGFVVPPPVGREILEFINLLVDLMDRAGISPLASGIIGSRTPGTTYTTALEAAMSKFTPLVGNAEMAMAGVVKLVWNIVENVIEKPIWVTGMGLEEGILGKRKARGRYVIDPKDIHGYYDLAATLKVSNLQDEISRGMHAAFMRAHKLWSRDRAMKFSGVEDPWEEFQLTMRDEMEESPFMKNQILKAAIESDPEARRRAAELEAQGISLDALLAGAPQGGGGAAGGTFGGAPQPRGQSAPGAGGRPSGTPRRAGGARTGTPQGGQFQK